MPISENDLVDGALTNRIIAAFYEVYRILKPGFLEAVYARALAHELRAAGLSVVEEAAITVWYKGVAVGNHRTDLLVEGRRIVELEATPRLHPNAREQLLNYLRGTSKQVGLLLHFGERPGVLRVYNPHASGTENTTDQRPKRADE